MWISKVTGSNLLPTWILPGYKTNPKSILREIIIMVSDLRIRSVN